ncbi:MAG: DEAD/DEAH box helicase family protein [Aeromicrobium sp.]|uniref:DEAD/DEAH box helicase family protein n=1 Tax=Aeromicrobium sp. TaxID=1871063 RepID=UPI0039E34A57
MSPLGRSVMDPGRYDDPNTSPFVLRRFQTEALRAVRAGLDGGGSRFWVSLPPGAGKTVLGLELIAELRLPAVVFSPNTAIQGQWVSTWSAYGRGAAGTNRDLSTEVTALTYQSLASFDADAEGEALTDRLHENGRALVRALRDVGPMVVVLDECHHLLEVWGALLAEVLAELDEAVVLGLTATPPTVMSARQVEQVGELFGELAYVASIPAAVREGDLAPFAEFAWLTTPSPDEEAWLTGSARRFVDLTTELVDPTYGSTPILLWFDARFTELPGPWASFERSEPDLARAALRLVHAGLLALPDGARLREEHRTDLTAADWAVLIDDWVRRCLTRSGDPRDDRVIADLRAALPGIGYQVSRRGVSTIHSPVDRVLSRSASKMSATAEILLAERAVLGTRMRAVVVCDFERASATSSGVLRDAPASFGSAVQVTATLCEVGVRAVLVTGRTVATTPDLAASLIASVPDRELTVEPVDGADGLVAVTGSWSSRVWVRAVTDFLESGGCEALVGTRALLGEGWDARGVTTLVDLSAATTPAAVIQTRGRALRRDPSWPDKVAITWSVVCVAPEHPGGHADWRRFVRKHEGYFGVDDDGQTISGVAHVDARLSPVAPPPVEDFALLNTDMSARLARRPEIAARWRVGEPYEDRVVRTIRLWSERGERPVVASGASFAPTDVPWARMTPEGAVWAATGRRVRRRPWRGAREAARDPGGLVAHAWVVADALAMLGVGGGASAVEAHIDARGVYRITWQGVDEAESAEFAEAVEELLAPIGSPRRVVARWVAPAPTWTEGWRVLFGRHRPVARVWYPVPQTFARNKRRRQAFAEAWARWMGPADLVDTTTPEGEAALAASRGSAPVDVHTVIRSAWS